MPRYSSLNPDQPRRLLTSDQRERFVRVVAGKILQRHMWQVGPLKPNDQAVAELRANASLDDTTNAIYLLNRNQWTELELLGEAAAVVSTYQRERLSGRRTLIIGRMASVDPEDGDKLRWSARTFDATTGRAVAEVTSAQALAGHAASIEDRERLEEFSSQDYQEFMLHVDKLHPWRRVEEDDLPFMPDRLERPDYGLTAD